MEQFHQRYQKLETLGQGSFGLVYKALDLKANSLVAVKMILMEDSEDEGIPATAVREISILNRFKHLNIVELKNVFVDQQNKFQTYLVFEYYEKDLRYFIRDLHK